MPCFKPLSAYRCSDGSVVFSELRRFDIVQTLSIPCGQCVGCRLERSRQWAMRCLHEASLYKQNCFITLTYADEHLPSDLSLHYADFQKFMKRLRKRFKDKTIRFYMAGEYGENFGRPHFHACIFNLDFPDKKLWKKTGSGCRIYRSEILEDLWPFGYSSIGDVNFQSAAYVARYIMKKVTGDAAEQHYLMLDFNSGEISKRTPEFNKMSLKPGIGYEWYKKFKSDVYPHDYVVINGKKVKPPKFYDKKLKNDFPFEWDEVEFKRTVQAKDNFADNTDERLAVKETIAKARLSMLKRELV